MRLGLLCRPQSQHGRPDPSQNANEKNWVYEFQTQMKRHKFDLKLVNEDSYVKPKETERWTVTCKVEIQSNVYTGTGKALYKNMARNMAYHNMFVMMFDYEADHSVGISKEASNGAKLNSFTPPRLPYLPKRDGPRGHIGKGAYKRHIGYYSALFKLQMPHRTCSCGMVSLGNYQTCSCGLDLSTFELRDTQVGLIWIEFQQAERDKISEIISCDISYDDKDVKLYSVPKRVDYIDEFDTYNVHQLFIEEKRLYRLCRDKKKCYSCKLLPTIPEQKIMEKILDILKNSLRFNLEMLLANF